MGPTVSYRRVVGIMPVPSIRPIEGLMVYNEARIEGVTRDPTVSVPIARGAKPALTAMADPDEDPSGLYVRLGSRCVGSSVKRPTLWPPGPSS